MKSIIDFLKQSNRWKHLVGGLCVGLAGTGVWTAIYASMVAASCLELKDVQQGNKPDWADWLLTILGGALAAFFWFVV